MSVSANNKDMALDIDAALKKRGRCFVKTDEDIYLFWMDDSALFVSDISVKLESSYFEPVRSLELVIDVLSSMNISIEGVR